MAGIGFGNEIFQQLWVMMKPVWRRYTVGFMLVALWQEIQTENGKYTENWIQRIFKNFKTELVYFGVWLIHFLHCPAILRRSDFSEGLTPHVQVSCSHYSWAQHCPTQWPNNLPSKVESERHNESMDFSWDLKRNWGYYLNLASSLIAPRLIVSLCMKFLFQKDTPFWQGTLLLSSKTGVIYHHGHRWLSDTDVGSTVGTAFWPVCLLQKCTYISPANSCIVTPHKLTIFWSHPKFCVKVGCRQTSEYWVLML